jgi:putative ABC transport system permease protein
MFKHLLQLIWNKKKQNSLLMLELFFSFFGLFVLFTFLLYPYNNYKLPTGFEPEHVWVVNFSAADEIQSVDSLQMFRESLKKVLLSMNMVQDVAYSSANIPFSGNGSNTEFTYNGKQIWANIYTSEDHYANVMGMQVLEGRWFTGDDIVSKKRPAVINVALKEKLFGNEDALGKIVGSDISDRMKIVGVVANSKDESPFEIARPALFQRMDTGNLKNHNTLVIKVKPGADDVFEGSMAKALSNTVKTANVEIEHITDMMETKREQILTVIIVLSLVAGFLLINVALGVFGVLWYNISRRRGEIGLRRAVGASGKSISRQLVMEALILATFSLLLGCFFAIQFPLLNMGDLPAENYVTAILLSIATIYILVIVCALYPGKQAAAVYPAAALHED